MENEKVKEFIARMKRTIATKEAGEDNIYFELKTETAPNKVLESCMRSVEKKQNELREERERVCFPIVNRGQVWYDTLTELQRAELAAWYRAWLNVTKTLKAPTMPAWLK